MLNPGLGYETTHGDNARRQRTETRRVALPPINLYTLHGFIGRIRRERRRLPFLLTGLALKLAPIESPA